MAGIGLLKKMKKSSASSLPTSPFYLSALPINPNKIDDLKKKCFVNFSHCELGTFFDKMIEES